MSNQYIQKDLRDRYPTKVNLAETLINIQSASKQKVNIYKSKLIDDKLKDLLSNMLESYGVDICDEYYGAPDQEYIENIKKLFTDAKGESK